MLQKTLLFSALALLSTLNSGCSKPGSPEQTPLDNDAIVRGRSVGSSNSLGKSVVALVADLNEGQALCTGSIVDESTVLTAAHCVDNDPQNLTVVFSPHVKGVSRDLTREVSTYVQNPRWQKQTARGRGDLALVHFEGGLPDGFVPVKLATAKALSLDAGQQVILIGYGVTNGLSHAGAGVLRATRAPIMGNASPTEIITDGHDSSVCFGDSGGPAFAQQGRDWVQWGVASSVTNDSCNEASIHTSITSYLRWIEQATNQMAQGSDDSAGDSNDETPNDTTSSDDSEGTATKRRRHPVELFVPDADDTIVSK